MINDMNIGADIDKRFKEECKNLPIPTDIKVLTIGHWPSQNQINVKLPPVLSYMAKEFEEWYLKSFKMRKL